jgi:purine-binding chemotaxis protein CheW
VSSEDLKHDALAAIQQLISQAPSAAAARQLQIAQEQFRVSGGAGGETATPFVGEQYLVFALSDREFAIKAELVQGVERLADITPVPNVVSWVKGVINLRGSIVSVVDLRMFLGLEPIPSTPRSRLLSLQSNDMLICLVVDGVSEMLPIPSNAIVNGNMRQATVPPWVSSYAGGSALIANRVMVILDVHRLLFSEKMHQYKAL